MANGYNIYWTDHAKSELKQTLVYLENNWTEKEIKNFIQQLEHVLELISKNPKISPASGKKKQVYKAVIARYNNLYYRTQGNTIQILSLFSNRQNPDNTPF